MEHVDFAYSLYESKKDEDVKRARSFKKTFSVHVEVEFIGVWDTVASVGLGAPTLPFNASETFVRTFRHALAIDERRAKFAPSTWQYRKSCECGSNGRTQEGTYKTIQELTGNGHADCGARKDSLCWCKEDERFHGGLLTDVQEVWFAGAHADVGGGYDKDDCRNSLANPPLRWMVTEILKAKPGVIFKKDAFEEISPYLAAKVKAFQNAPESPSYFGAKPHHHGHASEATVTNESIMTPPLTPGSSYIKKAHEGTAPVYPEPVVENVQAEATAKRHDELRDNKLWGILEILPLTQSWIKKDGTEVTRRWSWAATLTRSARTSLNFWGSRPIGHTIPLLHKSVKYRKDNPEDGSKPEDKYRPDQNCVYAHRIQYVHEDDDLPEDVRVRLAGVSYPEGSVWKYD
ncbi:hypothetical protein FS837_007600 [Tulasnella sp. UAMH 9824]|nr:hypothetical protein FS837_007600 [Tulasnella sp. UAMH 9824]